MRILTITLISLILTACSSQISSVTPISTGSNTNTNTSPSPTPTPHPLTISSLQTYQPQSSPLTPISSYPDAYNSTYTRVSYQSDNLTQYALLTIPKSPMPESGYPAIVFNHGYIPPDQYQTNQRYVAYVGRLAQSGYIVIRPDYRGHDQSEGEPSSAYTSNDYAKDILNALESLKNHPQVDPDRIGMWGHSMGGHLLLKSMVVNQDIKAGSIWAGVVSPIDQFFNRPRPTGWTPSQRNRTSKHYTQLRPTIYAQYGQPSSSSEFWKSTSANYYLDQLSGPLQIHHGTNDQTVPLSISQFLQNQLQEQNIPHEYYEYPGDDHNLSQSFNQAMQRTIDFFDQNL